MLATNLPIENSRTKGAGAVTVRGRTREAQDFRWICFQNFEAQIVVIQVFASLRNVAGNAVEQAGYGGGAFAGLLIEFHAEQSLHS